MKSSFYTINIFLLFIVIPFGNAISLLDFKYPSAISLLNQNVFVVEQKGIFVYDKQLKNIIYFHPFKNSNDRISVDKLSKVVIKFKANYIICLINGKIFFFDQEGKELLLEQQVIWETYDYPALIPITALNEPNNYYYVITYFIETNIPPNIYTYKQKLILYKIDTYTKSNTPINDLTINNMTNIFSNTSYDFLNQGLTCEYMQNDNEQYLVCFFIIKYDNDTVLSNNYFEITFNSINLINKFNSTYSVNITNDVVQMQSVLNEDRTISFVCLLFSSGNIECYKFHFVNDTVDTDDFYNETSTINNCKNFAYGLKLNYYPNGQTTSLSCIDSNYNIQIRLFNKSFDEINNITQFNQCNSIQYIYGHSIIKLDSGYYIISDIKCDNFKRCVEPLEGELSTNEIVPCNDTEKCQTCSLESLSKNLCIQCNEEKNYHYLNAYPYKERGKFIDCVNTTEIPPKFYFNEQNLDYEPCYMTCASCEYGGNSEENNCTSCDMVNYIPNPEEDNSNNCVVKCRYFYYIERNIYLCTDIPSCPEEHNFMYNWECFKECPDNTEVNDLFCKDSVTGKCHLTESNFYVRNGNITFNDVEKLVKKFAYEFDYTDNHVSLYKYNDYTVTIYFNSKCIFDQKLILVLAMQKYKMNIN